MDNQNSRNEGAGEEGSGLLSLYVAELCCCAGGGNTEEEKLCGTEKRRR